MNFLALTEEDITKFREDGPPSGLKACPHWSFMRPFKWQGEWWILFCCDDPNPRDEDFLGDFPRAKHCLPYRATREEAITMATKGPMIALCKASDPQIVRPLHLDNNFMLYDRRHFTSETRTWALELANEWVDSVEGD